MMICLVTNIAVSIDDLQQSYCPYTIVPSERNLSTGAFIIMSETMMAAVVGLR